MSTIKKESESEVTQLCPTFCDPWTVAHQAPPSMEFSRQEYWSRLQCPSPGDLPDPRIEPGSPALRPDDLPSEPPGKPKRSPHPNVCQVFLKWVTQYLKEKWEKLNNFVSLRPIPITWAMEEILRKIKT